VFQITRAFDLTSAVLCDHLANSIEESPWQEYRHGKPLVPSSMGKLKDFGIRPEKASVGGRHVYTPRMFEDAWRRYGQ
jgi:hypothetical protein